MYPDDYLPALSWDSLTSPKTDAAILQDLRNKLLELAPLLLVQTMLGHSDPKTTARYIGAFDQDDNTVIDFVRY